MTDKGLDYVPGLIAAYRSGYATDHVHLGYWPTGKSLSWEAAQAEMTRMHLDMLAPDDGMTIVDVGCGIGGSVRMLDTLHRDCEFVGVNIDARQLQICREQRPQNGNTLHWIEADAGATTLPDANVDRVLSIEAMFHFPSRAGFFSEAMRILRPGGILVCSDILFEVSLTMNEHACLDLILRDYAPWPSPTAALGEHARLGSDAGFIGIKTQDISEMVDQTWDHIVSSKESPLSSAQAAMRTLHRAGRMTYVVSVMQKPDNK